MTTTARRKPGPPKGDPYETILARAPKALIDRAKAYARRHQCSVSELIRDGLVWRLDEGDPHQSLYRAELANAPLHPGLVLVLDEDTDVIQGSVPVIQDAPPRSRKRKTAQAAPAAASMPTAEDPVVIQDQNDVLHEEVNVEARPLVPAVDQGEPQPPAQDPGDDMLDYDPSTYTLGALCRHQHEYGTTGKSLRRLSNGECRECVNDRQRKRQRRKKTATTGA